MPKAAWYIDGFNLYHALAARQETKEYRWLDLMRLAKSRTLPADEVQSVTFFSATPRWDHGKAQRHGVYCDALTSTGVRVVLGHFQVVDEECRIKCNVALKDFKKNAEKRTDVNIALRAFRDAALGGIESIYVLTADADQAPTAEFIKSLPGGRRVTFVFPPRFVSHELKQTALTDVMGPKSVVGYRLPPKINTPGRVIRCPQKWLWPGADPESTVGGA